MVLELELLDCLFGVYIYKLNSASLIRGHKFLEGGAPADGSKQAFVGVLLRLLLFPADLFQHQNLLILSDRYQQVVLHHSQNLNDVEAVVVLV